MVSESDMDKHGNMTLDIRIARPSAAEPWGFRLTGGADFDLPLTVVKVLPNSPALSAGLRNGDVLLSIGGTPAHLLTHDQAHDVIAGYTDVLEFGVQRGHYDMVLDEQDEFIPVDQLDDFDLQPEPTEVFRPIQFPEICDVNDKRETSRSLTASPFLLPTKPYRPFSTEPIPEIPPIEEPIILNPDYHDYFGEIEEDFLPKTRFKLPISEQYDPDFGKEKKKVDNNNVIKNNTQTGLTPKEEDGIKKEDIPFKIVTCGAVDSLTDAKQKVTDVTYSEMNFSEHFESHASNMESEIRTSEQQYSSETFKKKETSETTVGRQVMSLEELTVLEELSREVELEKIEETAASIVRESIERALSVAEEIKQEVDTELNSTSSMSKELREENKLDTSQIKHESNNTFISDKIKQLVEESLESKDSNQSTDVRQEIQETIKAGNVKTLSNTFEHSSECSETLVSSSLKSSYAIKNDKLERPVATTSEVRELVNKEGTKEKTSATGQNKQTSVKTSTTNDQSTHKEQKYTTAKLLAEQRAYTIGLQTIPKIRGTLHSSYHYNLLLKTFFIHLTDVMVALSRFILTEPALSNLEDQAQETEVTTETQQVIITNNEEIHYNDLSENVITTQEEVSKVFSNKKETKSAELDEHRINSESTDKKKVSGSQMALAQLSEHKAEELSTKMDAVISEFQNKTVTEENVEISTCNIKKNTNMTDHQLTVSSEKAEVKTLDLTQMESFTEINQSSVIENAETGFKDTRTESTEEKKEHRRSKSKDKIMYVGIVEAHVYTNKDEILDEQIMSDTSSLQSIEAISIVDSAQLNEIEVSKVETTLNSVGTDMKSSQQNETNQTEASFQKAIVVEDQTIETNKVSVESTANENIALQNETYNNVLSSGTVNEDVQALVITKKEVEAELENRLTSEQITYISQNEIISQKEESKISTFEAKQENSQTETITENSAVQMNNTQLINFTNQSEITEVATEEIRFEKSKILQAEAKTEYNFENIQPAQEEQISEKTVVNASINESKASESKSKSSCIKESTYKQTTEINQQQSSFAAKSSTTEAVSTKTNAVRPTQLPLKLDQPKLSKSDSSTSFPSTIDTPTPATIPPTPLTDEYIFRLLCPMPKNPGAPESRTPTPEETEPDDEDPHIVKKRLIPHIETNIERTVYDPPLQSPEGKDSSDVNGTRRASNGKGEPQTKEEILEIERKSSLLASAIDETIKSIQEYKQKVGMDSKRTSISGESNPKVEQTIESTPMYDDNVKEANTTVFTEKLSLTDEKIKMENDWAQVVGQLKINGNKPSEINSSSDNTNSKLAKEPMDRKDEMDENLTKIIKSKETSVAVAENVLKERNIFETQIYSAKTVETSCLEAETNVSQVHDNTVLTTSVDTPISSVKSEDKTNPMDGYRPVHFDPEEIQQQLVAQYQTGCLGSTQVNSVSQTQGSTRRMPSVGPDGETIGTVKGIVDSLDDTVLNAEIAKELGKAGMSEDKIAELISGESEMLREAHVMGLSRVIASHMSRVDDNDSSVDFKKIKPTIEKLKDSEVIKALNEELNKTKAEKKKEERKWTTFLQKPNRPVPSVKFGYHGWTIRDEGASEPYKVKIVKQPKPKVAPDYKPEDFETGPLPWEERAAKEPPPPPVDPEDPILIPEEQPVFLEAVDPLPETAVPDLEDTGIPLPPQEEDEPEETKPESTEETQEEIIKEEILTELDIDKAIEETEKIVLEDMEKNLLAEQLVTNVQNMVDPNASLEQQLAQMRQQLAALAQLPSVIQQTLELVTKQLTQITQETTVTKSETIVEETTVETTEKKTETIEEHTESSQIQLEQTELTEQIEAPAPEDQPDPVEVITQEVNEAMKKEERDLVEEGRKIEQHKKDLMDQMQLELESRQVKQHPTPRVGKPKPMFGPLTPQERPLVLPGGRKWRKPKDAFNEQFIAETLAAQAEIIQGKAKGINFMKYEKPPVSLDHLKESDVYKLVHNMETTPTKRVEMLTSVVAECDYREKCRSMTPCADLMP